MGAFGWLVGWFPGDVGGRGEACLAYLAVLCHLQARDCDATAVGRLAWGVPDGVGSLLLSGALERLDGVQRAAHVGALCDEQRAVLDERLGLLLVELVLRRTGQGDIHLANVDPLRRMELAATSSSSFLFPSLFLHHPGRDGGLQSHIFQRGGEVVAYRPCALDVLEGALAAERGQGPAGELDVGDLVDLLGGEVGVALGDESALGVGQRDDGSAQLNALKRGVLSDVAGARDGDPLALPVALAGVLDHVSDVVDETVAGGLF